VLPVFISRLEIDDERWNAAVKLSRQNVMYAYSWYLDVVCDEWCAMVWPSNKDYQIILPLPIKRKWGIDVIQQPLFCQYLGFFYQHEVPDALILRFLSLLDSQYPHISSYVFHPDNHLLISRLVSGLPVFNHKTLFTHWLRLDRSYDEIKSHYSKDRKTNLNRSLKSNQNIFESGEIAPLIDLFRRNHETRIDGGVSAKAYRILENLFIKLREHASAELWYAVANEEINAGVLIVRWGDFSIYLFNAATREARKSNARSVMLDNYFCANAGQELIFDFESPDIPSIASFYESFGAETKPLLSIRKNALIFPLNHIQNWRKRFLQNRKGKFTVLF
jgi:hypothetical protein